MRIFKTPKLITKILPDILWRMSPSNPSIYLTFDDGPIPQVTPWVLEILKEYSAKATFFCVGENVKKYPEILKSIKQQGNSIGNHTDHHVDGWKTGLTDYVKEVQECGKRVQSKLFRPPYGHLTPSQYRALKMNYKIVYWDLISYDFDPRLSPEKCLGMLKWKTQNGSILVFHDSLKSIATLKMILAPFLKYCQDEGYRFEVLPE